MLLVVAAAGFVISAVVLAWIWSIRTSRIPLACRNANRTATRKLGLGRLIIDGCNGPIQIRILRDGTGGGLSVQLFLNLSPGQDQPLDLVAKLQELCLSAVVVFDGCSQPWPFDVSERSFEWHSPAPPNSKCSTTCSQSAGSLSVLVTRLNEEADHVIAQLVKEGMEGASNRSSTVCNGGHIKRPIVRLVRSDQGPGRQKSVLRSLGMLQSYSVACLFPHDDWSPKLNIQARLLLSQMCQPAYKSLLLPVEEEWYFPSMMSIVVTDDVFLRQRVQHCMTFQQLHDFLADEKPDHHKHN
jgi:hypothetical protein